MADDPPAAEARREIASPALFLDGSSLAERPVRLELTEHGILILEGAEATLETWRAADLHCEIKASNARVHVTARTHPSQLLVVVDRELADRVLALCPPAPPPDRRRGMALALFWLVALVLTGGLTYRYMPQLARAVAVRIPLEQERALGARIEILLDFARCSDPAAEESLRTLMRSLAAPEARSYEVRMMQASEPNAFALPGGMIVVTTALLQEAHSPDEVAGVLAHEIEHVVQRHVLSGFLRDALLSALWAITMGDYTGLLVVDPTTVYRIANLEFSRHDEQAADQGAVRRLHRAGLSHAGLADFFARMEKKEGDGLEWLSTHPTHRQRIEELRRLAQPEPTRSALSEAQFQALRDACR